jgi:hypothetical protein
LRFCHDCSLGTTRLEPLCGRAPDVSTDRGRSLATQRPPATARVCPVM